MPAHIVKVLNEATVAQRFKCHTVEIGFGFNKNNPDGQRVVPEFSAIIYDTHKVSSCEAIPQAELVKMGLPKFAAFKQKFGDKGRLSTHYCLVFNDSAKTKVVVSTAHLWAQNTGKGKDGKALRPEEDRKLEREVLSEAVRFACISLRHRLTSPHTPTSPSTHHSTQLEAVEKCFKKMHPAKLPATVVACCTPPARAPSPARPR